MDKLYTAKEVAEMLRISYKMVYKYIYDDKLKAVKFGGNVRVRESDLKEFIEKGEK